MHTLFRFLFPHLPSSGSNPLDLFLTTCMTCAPPSIRMTSDCSRTTRHTNNNNIAARRKHLSAATWNTCECLSTLAQRCYKRVNGMRGYSLLHWLLKSSLRSVLALCARHVLHRMRCPIPVSNGVKEPPLRSTVCVAFPIYFFLGLCGFPCMYILCSYHPLFSSTLFTSLLVLLPFQFLIPVGVARKYMYMHTYAYQCMHSSRVS